MSLLFKYAYLAKIFFIYKIFIHLADRKMVYLKLIFKKRENYSKS